MEVPISGEIIESEDFEACEITIFAQLLSTQLGVRMFEDLFLSYPLPISHITKYIAWTDSTFIGNRMIFANEGKLRDCMLAGYARRGLVKGDKIKRLPLEILPCKLWSLIELA